MQYDTIGGNVPPIVYSFVMNEYVNPYSWPPVMDGKCWVRYRPVEHMPVVKGSLAGTIYNGSGQVSTFSVFGDIVTVTGCYRGDFNHQTGVITILYNGPPHEENYLCVSYEHGDDLPHKSSWLQEGF